MSKKKSTASGTISSTDIEKAAIGCIFKSDAAASYAFDELINEDFTDEINREIFEVSEKFFLEHNTIKRTLIESYFSSNYSNEQSYIYSTRISVGVDISEEGDIEDYCIELKELTFRRTLYDNVGKLQSRIKDRSVSVGELRLGIEKVNEAEFRSNPDTTVYPHEMKIPEQVHLVTGVRSWDNWWYKNGGRSLGTTELICGKTAHGKTTYLVRKICQFARNGYPGIIFNMEDVDGLKEKILAILDPETEMDAIKNIRVENNKNMLDEIVRDTRFHIRKHGIKWAAWDHVGKIRVRGLSHGDKHGSALIEISDQLTNLCTSKRIHGMLAVQPKKPYQRSGWDEQLTLDDLKGASELIEDAFEITSVFRPNMISELRKGVADQMYVKGRSGEECHFDSVFVDRLKTRSHRPFKQMLHMIQVGKVLYTKEEYDELKKEGRHKPKEHIKDPRPNPPDMDEDIPF